MRMVFRLKFLWRAPHVLVEETRKMLRILEAQLIGRLLDGSIGQKQLMLGKVEYVGGDVVLRPLSDGFLYRITEVLRRIASLTGEVFHCRKALLLRQIL